MCELKLSNFSGNRLILFRSLLLLFFFSGFSQFKIMGQSPYGLDFNAGLTMPSGDFKNYADNGFQTGLMFNKAIYKNLALGLSTNYNQLKIKDGFQSSDKQWSSFSLGVGPQYTLPINKFFIQLYGHLGVSFINAPILNQQQEGKPGYFEGDMTVFQLENGKNRGFYTSAGVKTGFNLSDKISLFVGSTYSTDLNKAVTYQHRDLSKAIHPSGEVHTDVINTTPFEKEQFSFSNLGINLGVSIKIGKVATKRAAQDYNSSRSNKPRPISAEVDNKLDSVARPAQDYNSSRSNRPTPISADLANRLDTIPRPAQDYNSSRSNRPTPISEDLADRLDTIPQSAQDYNSSRSNKPSPISKDIENGRDSLPRPAQDYNSSRSNRPTPIMEESADRLDTIPRPAQDYNSSRSNRPKPIMKDPADRLDTIPRPAQDYNSSRSNRPKPISEDVAGKKDAVTKSKKNKKKN